MVQVTASRGSATARGGAPSAAGADQVLEFAAGPVAGLGVGVVAVAAGDRDHVDAQAAHVVLRAGAGRRVGAESGTTGDGEVGAARWRVAARRAAVRGGGAIGVQSGDAPARAGVPGGSGDEVAGVGGVDQAERADLAGGLGHALQRLERHGDRDQRRDAWLGIVTSVAAGPTRIAGRRLGTVAPARAAWAAWAITAWSPPPRSG